MMNKLMFVLVSSIILLVGAQVTNYRLPRTVIPQNYNLVLWTELSNSTFRGSVDITIFAAQPTNTITLHVKDLAVTSVVLPANLALLNTQYFNNTEFFQITLTSNLIQNASYWVTLHFEGNLRTDSLGYYQGSYVNENNEVRQLAVTQFEPVYARRAFPCFDEPDLKATFRVNLIRNVNFISASNMPQESSVQEPGDPSRVRDIYQTSVTMPTYLVAFLVSDYANVSAFDNTFRVFGRAELLNRGEAVYANEFAHASTLAMENITNVNYSLPKIDQVAVPNNYFLFGAMENWGLITYRERFLMYNNETTTASEKQFTAIIIAHEIAHKWFGNIVTMQWWSYLWLKEGFATFFEIYLPAIIETDWDMMDQFQHIILQRAFETDAYETSRPMTRQVESPSELSGNYDVIVYEKAASVIKMIKAFLGDGPFYGGLRRVLDVWGYANIVPADLYDSWNYTSPNSDLNLSSILGSWETQSGYPVVTVTRNYITGITNFTQQRFLVNNATHNLSTRWHIPINWFTSNQTNNNFTWLYNDLTLNFNFLSSIDWLIVNNNREGYYRVNYDETNWRLIVNALRNNFTLIPLATRNQLVDDAFNLARSGRLHYSIAFDIGRYIYNETNFVPIRSFTNALSNLQRILTGRNVSNFIQAYGLEVLEGVYNRIGFDIRHNDTHLTKLTKVAVLTELCRLGHEECRRRSAEVFLDWFANITTVQPDAQNFIYCNALHYTNNLTHWDFIYHQYVNSREATQRTRFASALGCFRNLIVLGSFLQNLATETAPFPAADRTAAFTSLFSNNGVQGVHLALDFLIANFTQANQRFENINRVVENLAEWVTTEAHLSKLYAFVNTHRNIFTEAFNTTIQRALATAEINLNWINANSPQILDSLDPEAGVTPPTTTPGSAVTTGGQTFLILTCILSLFYAKMF